MQKNDRLLRVGVLGAGPISQSAHFDATRKARNAELYAICDAAHDLADKMAAIHEPQTVYYDFDAMLADPQVEAIIIGVADPFHIPLCKRAIAAGKHVMVEKPLGVTIEECESLCDQLRETKLVFQVGNNRRYDPGVVFAHQFIAEELGEMLSFKGWYHDSTLRYTMTDNLQPLTVTSQNARKPEVNPKADRKRYLLVTHGSHLIDMARFQAGEIVSVRARLLEKFSAYCWFVDLEFANGALGHLDIHVPVRGDFQEGFEIAGELGSVRCRIPLIWYQKASEVECFSVKDRLYRGPLGEDAYTYKLQIEGFADTILNGAPQIGADIDDGIATMRAMVAVARSAESGERVLLRDVSGGV